MVQFVQILLLRVLSLQTILTILLILVPKMWEDVITAEALVLRNDFQSAYALCKGLYSS